MRQCGSSPARSISCSRDGAHGGSSTKRPKSTRARLNPVLRADGIAAFAPYRDTLVGALVREAKLHVNARAQRLLGSMLAAYLAAEGARSGSEPGILVPVPLSAQRLRERGQNQAQRIAEAAAARLPTRMEPGILVRVRHTAPQTGLGGSERRANMAAAFAATGIEPART